MKIVVLDGYTLNPGDLSWTELETIGECTVYDRTPPEQVIARSSGAEIVLTNKVLFPSEVIQPLGDLKYIGMLATGYDGISLSTARDKGVTVCNVPGYSTQTVAQMVFALLLELTHHVGHHDRTVHQGKWIACPDTCYWDYPLVELAGLTMGIVGFGRIGQAVAAIAEAFGMKVIAHRKPSTSFNAPSVTFADLDKLFVESDVISLNCPLTEQTRGFVDEKLLSRMKSTAFLINTGRGKVINEPDLAAALNADKIAGAAMDVLAVEPPQADNPLLTAKNCIITPHLAWATRAARQRLMDIVVANIRAFQAGAPQNVVS